jgi:hypothetical protein
MEIFCIKEFFNDDLDIDTFSIKEIRWLTCKDNLSRENPAVIHFYLKDDLKMKIILFLFQGWHLNERMLSFNLKLILLRKYHEEI